MKRFLFVGLAALCVLSLACSESELVNPDVESEHAPALGAKGGKPDPAPVPAGTIYMGMSGSVYETDTDGGSRRDTKVSDGNPSRDLHGGTRWFALVLPAAGIYPDGRSRYELFLVNDGATDTVQVTGEPDLEVLNSVNWRPNGSADKDAYVTFLARRISAERCLPDTTSGFYLEGGIYAASVSFDAGSSPTIGPVSLLVPSEPMGRCNEAFTAGHHEPRVGMRYGGHDWSPDGDSVAVAVHVPEVSVDLMVFDPETPSGVVLTEGGEEPSWSVKNEIVFRKSRGLYRIKVDGTGETLLVDSQNAGGVRYPDYPHWSPDGEYLVYTVYRCCIKMGAEVYRATRVGSARKNLTRDQRWAYATGWR